MSEATLLQFCADLLQSADVHFEVFDEEELAFLAKFLPITFCLLLFPVGDEVEDLAWDEFAVEQLGVSF
jgi:hypothetical protein